MECRYTLLLEVTKHTGDAELKELTQELALQLLGSAQSGHDRGQLAEKCSRKVNSLGAPLTDPVGLNRRSGEHKYRRAAWQVADPVAGLNCWSGEHKSLRGPWQVADPVGLLNRCSGEHKSRRVPRLVKGLLAEN